MSMIFIFTWLLPAQSINKISGALILRSSRAGLQRSAELEVVC